jgi:hypothetical protein
MSPSFSARPASSENRDAITEKDFVLSEIQTTWHETEQMLSEWRNSSPLRKRLANDLQELLKSRVADLCGRIERMGRFTVKNDNVVCTCGRFLDDEVRREIVQMTGQKRSVATVYGPVGTVDLTEEEIPVITLDESAAIPSETKSAVATINEEISGRKELLDFAGRARVCPQPVPRSQLESVLETIGDVLVRRTEGVLILQFEGGHESMEKPATCE